MTPREQRRLAFLRLSGWEQAQMTPLAGDASTRCYLRLTGGPDHQRAILMDADPQTGDTQHAFVQIAGYLTAAGFSAPRIFAADIAQGFVLLEDYGDGLFAKILAYVPAQEAVLYRAAADCLAALHRQPAAPDLLPASADVMAKLIDPAFEWYAAKATSENMAKAKIATVALLGASLRRHASQCSVTVLRDFHAENLIWLPERTGICRVGLLDFQDAVVGHPAYDLVSLTRDARRDLGPGVAALTTQHYLSQSPVEPAPFLDAAAVLSVQRNLRILGIFVRLAFEAGKTRYLDLLPRVWDHMLYDLAHPDLSDIARVITDNLPAPDSKLVTKLKAACPQTPTP